MPIQPVINKFIKGVNTDIAEESIGNDTLSNGHNIKITNNDGKQGIVQKADFFTEKINGYPESLIPLAAREYNDVVYIVSYNIDNDCVEYGTYPSADISGIDPNDTESVTVPKVYEYAPLPNYKAEISASPSTFVNIQPSSPSTLYSTVTTSDGGQWVVQSTSSGVSSTVPTTGKSGDSIGIKLTNNTSGLTRTETVTITMVDANASVTISLEQDSI